MTDTERGRARELATTLQASLTDLCMDLHSMSDEVVAIEWANVQADFQQLARGMAQ